MRRLPPALFGAAAAVAVAGACGTTEVPVLSTDQPLDATAPGPDVSVDHLADRSADVEPEGHALAEAGDALAGYCSGSGPPMLLGFSGKPICSGQLAGAAFRFAACTCAEFTTNHALTTDAFDGSKAPNGWSSAVSTFGGSVGTNLRFSPSAPVTIGGSLWVADAAGMAGVATNATMNVYGDLHVAGLFNSSSAALSVGGSAWLAGGLTASGDVSIGGALYVPAGQPTTINGTKSILGGVVNQPFAVQPPCDCAASSQVDIPKMVRGYAAANDDAATGVDPNLLDKPAAAVTATLPCGRLYLTGIATDVPVHLTVPGRTALFVAGDFQASQDFVVDVPPPGGELDLFVEGNMVASKTLKLGDRTNPARARTYVGGTGTVNLGATTGSLPVELSGNLYAPKALIVLNGGTVTVFGAIFANKLNATADLVIHFDESVALEGSECGQPTTCNGCGGECGQKTCVNGMCSACGPNADCCPPAVCRSEACVLDIR